MDTFTDEQSLVGHNSAPIVEAARLCENGFSDLLESSSSPDYEKIEEGAARFRIWAGYLGIFADFHASLDYRVRDSELVKSLCLSQLRTLEDTIAQLMKPHLTTELQDQQVNIKTSQKFARLRSQLRKTFGRSSSSSKSRTIESEGIDDNHHGNLMEMLENTIDRLYRLAKEIRKPGSISKASKAERFAPLDEFGNDVVQSFERFTLDLVRVRLDGTKPFLQHRLAKANAARRRLFLYRLEHQEVLRYRHDHQHPHDVKKKQQFPPQDIHYNTSYIPTHPPNPSVSRKSQNKKTVAFGNPPPMPPTEVSARATTFVESEFRLSTSSKAPIADNGTSIRGVLGNGRLPAPPKIPAARKEFECKFCCQLIPAKFAKKNEWQ
ncbi:hypothetical protein DM02DRAFT_309352 [Periconia macrospinosa]|uniref:Uncharacterized protein n=1 Tax=Periconia macrospinosa TaxID=97972 RepID=A0A2V1D1P8_9PLEO|nr:hypothetical protein DM02DRAFT_309352 [Periconia macrospinosa]